MPVTTISSRQFNQDTSGAKKAALDGPVFITDRGQPAHALLSIEAYRQLAGANLTLKEAVEQADDADFEFDPERFDPRLKPADLS